MPWAEEVPSTASLLYYFHDSGPLYLSVFTEVLYFTNRGSIGISFPLLRDKLKPGRAHSTDLQSPESVEHLCAKCDRYAQAWKPTAEKLWKEK